MSEIPQTIDIAEYVKSLESQLATARATVYRVCELESIIARAWYMANTGKVDDAKAMLASAWSNDPIARAAIERVKGKE